MSGGERHDGDHGQPGGGGQCGAGPAGVREQPGGDAGRECERGGGERDLERRGGGGWAPRPHPPCGFYGGPGGRGRWGRRPGPCGRGGGGGGEGGELSGGD